MAEAKIQKRNTYTIYDDEGIGTVQIADEVVAIIAGLAATEVDGGSLHGRKYYQRISQQAWHEKSFQGCQS